MQLPDIKKPLAEMTDAELRELLPLMRSRRYLAKATSLKLKPEKRAAVKSKETLQEQLKSLSPAEILQLIHDLEAE